LTCIQPLQGKIILWAILSISFLNYSCSDPATVGLELAPGNNQIGVFFQEFDLPAKVVLLDSFNTTNQGVLIVGEEEDPFFGKTSGIGFSRMYIDSRDERPSRDAFLDSVFFNIDVVSVNGENLEEPKYYSIHQLAEPLRDTLYYNFDKLAYDVKPFSEGEILFGDVKDTTVSLQVDEDFALEMFDKLQRGREFNDLFSFRDYFPGIAIKARKGDDATIGVNLGFLTNFTFYYHLQGDTVSSVYEISTASSRSFNGIESDRSGTPNSIVQVLGKDYDVGPLVGLKANLGMVFKIDTSPLDPFLDTLKGITFNQVNFEIGKIEDQPETQTPPTSMVIYFTDATNEILIRSSDKSPLTLQTDGQSQTELDASGNIQPSTKAPAILTYFPDKEIYITPIASYLGALYRKDITRKDWLIYGNSPSSTGDAFKRSFRQFTVDQENIKIKVVYSKIR
jgi:hypothetical protein